MQRRDGRERLHLSIAQDEAITHYGAVPEQDILLDPSVLDAGGGIEDDPSIRVLQDVLRFEVRQDFERVHERHRGGMG